MTTLSYVAIDFETANSNYSSACSVGLTKVVDGNIIDHYYSLINPEEDFDSANVHIHGITDADVVTAPTLPDLHRVLFQFIGTLPLVAHNAPFDMRVLQSGLNKYQIKCPTLPFFCSLVLSRQLLSLPSYRLDTVAHHYAITFGHHQASEDARVCAQIVLRMFSEHHITSIDDMIARLHYHMGSLSSSGIKSFSKKAKKYYPHADFKPSDIVSQRISFDFSHPFYQKVFVFTGLLKTMDRREACQKVADLGGINGNNVTKKTNFLVIGDQDAGLLQGHAKSSKLRRAEQLVSEGQPIQIIFESDFLKLI
ncbi:MAG: exonuclease domain-containing protein [Sporolactobacillus sp.]